MKNLVIAALALGGLMQATGCIIVSDDDVADSSSFLVTWNLESELQASPGAVGCADADVDTIRVVSQPVGGAQIFDFFDCIDGTHETDPLPLNDYLVWVQALDINEDLVAESFSSEETLFDANPVGTTFTFPVDIGFFGLTWTLEDTGSVVTCADVGSAGVAVVLTPTSDTSSYYDQEFNCIDGTGRTSLALPLEAYSVSVAVVDSDGFSLSESNATSQELTYGNEVRDLGNYIFDFTPDP